MMAKLLTLLLIAFFFSGEGIRIPIALKGWVAHPHPGYLSKPAVPAIPANPANQPHKGFVGVLALNNARLAIANSGHQIESTNGDEVEHQLQQDVLPLTDFKLNEVQEIENEIPLAHELETSNDADMNLYDLPVLLLPTEAPISIDHFTTINYRKRYREREGMEKNFDHKENSNNNFQDFQTTVKPVVQLERFQSKRFKEFEGGSNQQSVIQLLQTNKNLDNKAWELGRGSGSNTRTTVGGRDSGAGSKDSKVPNHHRVPLFKKSPLMNGEGSTPPPDRNPTTASPHGDYIPATLRNLVPDNFLVGENTFLQFAQNNPEYFSNPNVLNVPENMILVRDARREYLQYGEYADIPPNDHMSINSNSDHMSLDGFSQRSEKENSVQIKMDSDSDSDFSLSKTNFNSDDDSIASSNDFSVSDRPTSYVVASYTREGVEQGLYNGQQTIDVSRRLTNDYVASDSRGINNNDGLFDAGHIISNTLGGHADDHLNLFPQNYRINRGIWRDFEQQVLRMRNNPNHARTIYEVRLDFGQHGETIPSHITGMARSFDSNNRMVDFVTARMPNPVTGTNVRLERIENIP